MESDRLEFDKPPSKKLHPGIAIVNQVAGRIKEINRLYNDIVTTKTDMLLHQMLPNHMRRRAMSHNPKRLPLKHRQVHTNQMAKSGPTAKKRRPSRKYRRKPGNLLKEYARRKQKNVWLETHVWHAKRFHLKELWGYKIPFAPTDKRYRASYKAAASHCLLQDISFMSALEVTGPIEKLRENFRRIMSQECGLTLMAKCFQSGAREGEVDVFEADSYPMKAIARVSFMWRPAEASVWIFVHPSAYRELLQELVKVFELKNLNRSGDDEGDVDSITRNDSKLRNPKYLNDETKVELVELKDTLNRFRLTGPSSNAVLLKALKPATNFDNWLGEKADLKAHEEQTSFWSELSKVPSPSQLPPHMILGLNVVDPRTNRPLKREKAVFVTNSYDEGFYLEQPALAANSAIWDKNLRDEITKSMMTTGELCKLRSKNQLVPGIPSAFEKDLQPLPLLLVQRPGSQSSEVKRLGFGSGWDVVVPSGYGLSVWLSLIRCGAKPGGWRETETLANESGSEVFKPDTISGRKESARILKLKRDEYFRKPPNKRTNFVKMGISSPFSCPFSLLVKEWSRSEVLFKSSGNFSRKTEDFPKSSENFSKNNEDSSKNNVSKINEAVSKNNEKSSKISGHFPKNNEDFSKNNEKFSKLNEEISNCSGKFLKNNEEFSKNNEECSKINEDFHVLRNKSTLENLNEVLKRKKKLSDLNISENALIPVTLLMDSRGTPGDFGLICLPSKRDIKASLSKKYQKDRGPVHFEPQIPDDLEKERKLLRNNHKALLKRLRNRRVRAKRRLQATANYHVKIQKSSAEKIIQQQYEKMCEMWLPKKPSSVRNQCSRQVFGYLTCSKFTFSEGKVSGVGYATKKGLEALLQVFQKFRGLSPFVITRATNSKCFYTAKVVVRVD